MAGSAPEVAVAYVSIVPSLQGFQRDLRRQVVGPSADAGTEAGTQMGSRLGTALKAGAAGAALAAGALIATSLVEAIDQAKIQKTLQVQLGATGKDADRYGKIAGKLYTQGVTANFQEGADAIRAIMRGGLVPPDATNKQLQSIATKMTDVSKTFGTDMQMQTQAVSAMLKNGLAPNASAALDVIAVGMQKLGPNADDLLDTFQEYSVQFKKMGLDSETTLGLFQQGIQGGARDTDILADAIKEFSIRSVDGSEKSADAYKALGLSASDMTAQFGKGGKSAALGLDKVLDSLRAMKDPVAREAAAVGLFGTQAEDLGAALYALDPSSATAGLGKLGGAADKMGKTLRTGPMHELEVFVRELRQGLVDTLTTYVLPVIADLAAAVLWVARVAPPAFRWAVDAAQWLAPLAILIGGITIAMNAQAIAVALVTGVLNIYRAATLVGIAVTNGFAAAQAVLNAVMALNPFVLVAIALAALVALVVVAYNKSDTFRRIVQAAWAGIQAAALYAWDKVLKPIFQDFGRILTWVYDVIVKPIFALIVLAFQAWWFVARTIFAMFFTAIKMVGSVFKWLYDKVIKPVAQWIGEKIAWIWKNGVQPTFQFIRDALAALGKKFKELYTTYVKPVAEWIGDKVAWVWKNGIKPAFDSIKKAVGLVGDSFGKAKDAIKSSWSKLEDIAKKPVRFIVNTVYNGGIVPTWNKIASAFGAPKLSKYTLPSGFARGGILPGTSSWRNGDDQLVPMRRGEGVYVSEAMRDPYERARLGAVNNAAMRGESLAKFRDSGFAKGGIVGQGFAKGGILDWVGKSLQGAGSAAWDGIKKGAGWLKDTMAGSVRAGMNAVVNPLLDKIPGSSSLYGKAIKGIPSKIIDSMVGYSADADKRIAASGMGGAGTKRALTWARTQAGKPYQWAGAGNPSWDCSGFMSGIQKKIMGQNPNGRLWSTFAFSGDKAPSGWHRGMKAPFMVGITNAGVGHTAGTLNGTNVESRGGAGVVVGKNARGYKDSLFSDWYGFAPSKKYDSGGWLQPGATMAQNKTGKPEPILTASQWGSVSALAARGASGGLADGARITLVTEGGSFEAYVDSRADKRIDDELVGPAGLGRGL